MTEECNHLGIPENWKACFNCSKWIKSGDFLTLTEELETGSQLSKVFHNYTCLFEFLDKQRDYLTMLD